MPLRRRFACMAHERLVIHDAMKVLGVVKLAGQQILVRVHHKMCFCTKKALITKDVTFDYVTAVFRFSL